MDATGPAMPTAPCNNLTYVCEEFIFCPTSRHRGSICSIVNSKNRSVDIALPELRKDKQDKIRCQKRALVLFKRLNTVMVI
jgi:hypothetical protein